MKDYSTKNLHKISDKAQYTEVYHLIMKSAEEYSRLSMNVPRSLIEVSQHIHGHFDEAAYFAYRAMNIFEPKEKLLNINKSKDCIFFQYSSIEYLVKTKAITVGSANLLIDTLGLTFNQLCKWYNAILKDSSSDVTVSDSRVPNKG